MKRLMLFYQKFDGLLSKMMPMSAIQAANTAVRAKLLESPFVTENDVAAGSESTTCTSKCREKYQFFTPKEKVEYRRRAAEYGITPTIPDILPKLISRSLPFLQVPYLLGKRTT